MMPSVSRFPNIASAACTPPATQSPTLLSLPTEVQNLIALNLDHVTDAINFAWTCRSLYQALGPSNRFLWYQFYRERLDWDAREPSYTPYEECVDYYTLCLDIVCERREDQDFCCSRCLSRRKAARSLYIVYICRVFQGRYCYSCFDAHFYTLTEFQKDNPLVEVHPTIFAESVSTFKKDPTFRRAITAVSKCTAKIALRESVAGRSTSELFIALQDKAIRKIEDTKRSTLIVMEYITELYQQHYTVLHPVLSAEKFSRLIWEDLLRAHKREPYPNWGVFGQNIKRLAETYLLTVDNSAKLRQKSLEEACSGLLAKNLGPPDDYQRLDTKQRGFLHEVFQNHYRERVEVSVSGWSLRYTYNRCLFCTSRRKGICCVSNSQESAHNSNNSIDRDSANSDIIGFRATPFHNPFYDIADSDSSGSDYESEDEEIVSKNWKAYRGFAFTEHVFLEHPEKLYKTWAWWPLHASASRKRLVDHEGDIDIP
ncbi:hypothetical protein ABW19_dt0205641 [Dactylella cylindrospora]|nr:hypothetical protein ABW19_dt0205641 [Dactylella cylindrospora]